MSVHCKEKTIQTIHEIMRTLQKTEEGGISLCNVIHSPKCIANENEKLLAITQIHVEKDLSKSIHLLVLFLVRAAMSNTMSGFFSL